MGHALFALLCGSSCVPFHNIRAAKTPSLSCGNFGKTNVESKSHSQRLGVTSVMDLQPNAPHGFGSGLRCFCGTGDRRHHCGEVAGVVVSQAHAPAICVNVRQQNGSPPIRKNGTLWWMQALAAIRSMASRQEYMLQLWEATQEVEQPSRMGEEGVPRSSCPIRQRLQHPERDEHSSDPIDPDSENRYVRAQMPPAGNENVCWPFRHPTSIAASHFRCARKTNSTPVGLNRKSHDARTKLVLDELRK